MARIYLCVYLDQEEAWLTLSESERGRLITAAIAYKKRGELPELTGNERFQWPVIKAQIDRDNEGYADKVEKCSNAGRISASRRQQTSTDVNRRQRTLTDVGNRIEENRIEQNKTEQNIPTGRQAPRADVFAEWSGGDGDLLSALKEFDAFRKKMRKPLTDEAKRRLVSKLDREFSPGDWIAVLHQSIDQGWTGIYPIKKDEDRPAKTTGPDDLSETYKMMKEWADEQ